MANNDSNTLLYNGLHVAKFQNSLHRYYIDGVLKPGVTTIMSKVLAKPDLMLWPLNMAIYHLEERLMHGPLDHTDLIVAKGAHIKRRDSGASTGTIVHSHVERLLVNPNDYITDKDDSSEVVLAVHGFIDWQKINKPTVIAVEQIVYSHTHSYAGTFDSILKIGDKVYLCDLKTTNASRSAPKGVYSEYFIQLGAYLYAYDEQREYELAHGGTKLIAIDDLMIISCKKDGKVDTCTASELHITPEECKEMWLSTLLLRNSLSKLKVQLGGK